MHPHGNGLVLALLPIPMGKEVEHRLRSPPCFVVIEVVFGKAAHVDDAELRIDRWPSVRGRLPAAIDPRPGQPAGEPFPGGIDLPPPPGELRPEGGIKIETPP